MEFINDCCENCYRVYVSESADRPGVSIHEVVAGTLQRFRESGSCVFFPYNKKYPPFAWIIGTRPSDEVTDNKERAERITIQKVVHRINELTSVIKNLKKIKVELSYYKRVLKKMETKWEPEPISTSEPITKP